jgi:hypothetical protein
VTGQPSRATTLSASPIQVCAPSIILYASGHCCSTRYEEGKIGLEIGTISGQIAIRDSFFLLGDGENRREGGTE